MFKSNKTNMKNFLLVVFSCLFVSVNYLQSQCTPAAADACDGAAVLCSLDELSGYTCSNTTASNPTACLPCNGGGAPHNSSWWAFVTDGGNVTVTITFSGCYNPNGGNPSGVQIGIVSACDCSGQIACEPGCSGNGGSITINGSLQPCKIYYLWVDGCNGDVCNFTITTSGGGRPPLSPLGNITSSQPNPICKGCCADFAVAPQPGGCVPEYVWTLNGTQVGGNTNMTNICFPDEGTFSVCVYAAIGNPSSGSICAQTPPKCINVVVEKKAEQIAKPRIVCPELSPYKWWCELATTSGTYRCPFKQNGCCEFDSVVDITFLDKIPGPDVYFIGCQGEQYVDPTTKIPYAGCNNRTEVKLSKATRPYGCDSSYFLSTIYPTAFGKITIFCRAGEIILNATLQPTTALCGNSPDLVESLEWYEKLQPQRVIGTDKELPVTKKSDYCVRYILTYTLGDKTKTCKFDFCESIDENGFIPTKAPIAGPIDLCLGETGFYFMDTMYGIKINQYIWRVTGGEILTKKHSDSSRIEIKWTGPPGLSGEICLELETNCGNSPEVCLPVFIRPAPTPNAGPDVSVCKTSDQLNATRSTGTNGQWTQVSGPGSTTFGDQLSPNSTISVTAFGKYKYVWSESDRGCDGRDTVEYLFNEIPDKGQHSFICDASNTKYKVTFRITGGIAPYTIIQGGGTIDPTSNTYTSADILNNTPTLIIIEDAKGCRFTFTSDNECKCNNLLGTIPDDITHYCEDESFDFTQLYNNAGELREPNDTLIFLVYTDTADILGSRIFTLSGNTIQYDPTKYQFDRVYYVGVTLGKTDSRGWIDGSKGCQRVEGNAGFVFHQNPNPTAGPDDKICGTTYTLNGTRTNGIANAKLTWRVIAGNVQVSNTADEDPTINTLGNYGTFEFELEEDNFGCKNTSRVKITFNPDPAINNVDKICVDLLKFTFRVEADITKGTPPFTLLTPGGSITGNKYKSDTLISLDTFRILVQDANGCISSLYFDTHNCNCGTIDQGKLDDVETSVCDDQCIPVKSLIAETLPPGKIVNYVVSSTNTLVGLNVIERINANTCVTFQASKGMTHNTTYYILRIVGEDLDGDGIVDVKDPCSRMTFQPISWNPYPIADAGQTDSICGLSYKFKANLTLGNGTWRPLNGGTISDVNAANADLTAPNYGTYSFEWSVDNESCIRKDTVNITFWDAPEFLDNTLTFECDNTAENYRIVIDVQKGEQASRDITGTHSNGTKVLTGSWLDNNTWRSDWIPSGSDLALDLNDRHDCLPDKFTYSHICNCLTNIGLMDLTPIILCADGTADAGAKYSGQASDLDGNDIKKFVLYSGASNDPKNGTVIKFNDNGIFTFDPATMVLGKTYFVAVFVGNIDPTTGNVDYNDRCMKNTPGVPITWYAYPEAKINGNQLLNCNVLSITLNGGNSISGSGSTLIYLWSTQNGRFVNPNVLDQSTVDINAPGTYKLFVTDPISKCTNEITYNITQDIIKPSVSIGKPEVLTCDKLQVTLNGSGSSTGADFSPAWTGPSIVSGANTLNPTVDQPGTYTLTVNNTKNGCSDVLSIQVLQDIREPIANLRQIGDLTCSIRQVQLDASASTAPNGAINSFVWNPKSEIISGEGTAKVTIGAPGTFDVTIKDPVNGCLNKTTITVKEIGNPLNLINLNGQDPLCYGDKNGLVQIVDVLDINNQPLSNLQFSINGGPFVSSKDFPNLGEGKYTITVKDANGCLKSGEVNLVQPSPLAISVIKEIFVDQGNLVDLDSLVTKVSGGTPGYENNKWFDLNKNIDVNNIYKADTTGDFEVTVLDANGCEIREKVRINIIIQRDVWWPNAISANYDKINDKFNLWGKRVREISLLRIYDRWGELVYEGKNLAPNDDLNNGWNGEFRNEKALVGVYTFYAEVKYIGTSTVDKVKGDFTLLR